ncbi:MAG: toll/interleukin-1 receptor domain-containing protein, partial [Chloroflexi bacterium]|nr:toll/interleukin-1 receptor domain-containing protein [Chloroflexota bacterium]
MSYDTAKIRQFIRTRFNTEELTIFLFDYFPDVHENMAPGMTKGQRIQYLLDHAKRRNMDDLLAALERERPDVYPQADFMPQHAQKKQPVTPIARNPRQIFISHAHQDAELAHQLADDLEADGWTTWIAPNSIQPGEKWVEAISRGLDGSGLFVLLLTPDAVKSSWVRDETNVAIELKNEGELQFLPLQIKPCKLPALWRAYQRIPFRGGYDAGLLTLLTRLNGEQPATKKPQKTIKPRIEFIQPPPQKKII